MTEPPDEPFAVRLSPAGDRLLRLAAGGLALLCLASAVRTMMPRLDSPWPLEWMEGAVMLHGQRLGQGQALYGPPTGDFVPLLYPPLAYVPGALLARAGVLSLPALHYLSAMALLLILSAVQRMVQRSTGYALGGFLASALFGVGYGYGGAFLDLARVDVWFLVLLVLGLERVQAGRIPTGLALLALSAFAKQHGALFFFAVSAALLRSASASERPAIGRVVAAVALVSASAAVALEVSSDGYFSRYVVELPASHGVEWPLLVSFLLIDLGLYLPVLSGSTLLALRRGGLRDPSTAALATAVVVSAMSRAHPGGHDNVRLPALALLCAVGSVPLLSALLARAASRSKRLWAAAALCAQCALLWQPPGAHAPTAQAERAFAALDTALTRCAAEASVGSPPIALDYSSLSKAPAPHTMALSDLSLGQGDPELSTAARAALLDRLAGPEAPRAVMTGTTFPALQAALDHAYVPCATLPAPPMASGYQPPPQTIYRRP